MHSRKYTTRPRRWCSGPHQRPYPAYLPRPCYIVLQYLRSILPLNVATRHTNAQIRDGVGFGSEGEISAIMRWLAGEHMPDSPHRYLREPAAFVYVERQRCGRGYVLTVREEPRTPEDDDQKPFTLSGGAKNHAKDHDVKDHGEPESVPPVTDQTAPFAGHHDPSSIIKKKDLVVVVPPSRAVSSELQTALHELGAYPSTIRRILAAPPGNASDLRADMAAATKLFADGRIQSAIGVTIAAWLCGSRVQTRSSTYGDERPRATAGRSTDSETPTGDPERRRAGRETGDGERSGASPHIPAHVARILAQCAGSACAA